MAETMLVGVDVGGTFTDLVPVDRRAADELRRRGRR
jgi:N-methylhydantoinase A/oxoprolinase/acetone carboxylase beta subunit